MQQVKKTVSRHIVRASWLMYAIMGLVGLSIMKFSESDLSAQLQFSDIGRENLLGLGFLNWLNALPNPESLYPRIGLVVLLATSAISMIVLPLDRVFGSIGLVKNVMARTLGSISIWSALGLSLISAVSEEILFRGALQPLIGIPLTITAYVVIHSGPNGVFSAWSLQSLAVGAAFSTIFEQTGNLPLLMVIHFLVNMMSFLQVRRAFSRFGDQAFMGPSLLGNP